jgi:hypothetical protein
VGFNQMQFTTGPKSKQPYKTASGIKTWQYATRPIQPNYVRPTLPRKSDNCRYRARQATMYPQHKHCTPDTIIAGTRTKTFDLPRCSPDCRPPMILANATKIHIPRAVPAGTKVDTPTTLIYMASGPDTHDKPQFPPYAKTQISQIQLRHNRLLHIRQAGTVVAQAARITNGRRCRPDEAGTSS